MSTPRIPTEQTMTTWDGTSLFYRRWRAEKPSGRALVLFHRGHEHSGRWQDVVDKLDLPGFDVFAWDARGHGRSPGERGHAGSFLWLVKDVDAFMRHVALEAGLPMSQIAILAHSVGSVVVSTWVHDFAPPIRALVLGSPALRVRLYVPFAIPGLRLLLAVKGKAFVKSYVKAKLLTHDPAKIASYESDSLIERAISVRILLGLYDAATRLLDDAGAITVPAMVLTSGGDWVVEQPPQRRFFEGLSSNPKEMRTFAGFFHDTFNEKDNHLPIGEARRFLLDAFERPYAPPPLRDAHRSGYTKDEQDRLEKPLPLLSPKRIGFALTRLSMATLGRLSEGIRVGWKTGFDSGSMLDYVYENRARGITPLGRLIDRGYLDSVGWRGIRIRKRNLEKLLTEAVSRVKAAGLPAHVVDVAAGHGRYDLEALKAIGGGVTAQLRDYSPINVDAGRALIREMGLGGVTFEAGDAFDRAALAALSPRPTVAVVSGLYELFPDNDRVAASLAGLGDAVPSGGYLVYTGQPWHPQLEFIARVLTSHRGGAAWVMRRRTQQEMDQLVEAAGFEKVAQEIDEMGIFSVSLARRR